MSKIALALKINVSAMDTARLFNGQKGQYLDCTVFVDLDQLDQYGNSGMITQDVSKEEKQQGVKGNILGNAKIFWTDTGRMPQAQQQGSYNGQQQQPQQQGGYQQQPPQRQQRAPQQQNNQQQYLGGGQTVPQQQQGDDDGWGDIPY
jgi:hypothetical protein